MMKVIFFLITFKNVIDFCLSNNFSSFLLNKIFKKMFKCEGMKVVFPIDQIILTCINILLSTIGEEAKLFRHISLFIYRPRIIFGI